MVSASSDVVSIKEMDCLIPLLIGQSHFPRGISGRLSDWLGTAQRKGWECERPLWGRETYQQLSVENIIKGKSDE